jgi:hypothetical protein
VGVGFVARERRATRFGMPDRMAAVRVPDGGERRENAGLVSAIVDKADAGLSDNWEANERNSSYIHPSSRIASQSATDLGLTASRIPVRRE